MEANYRLYPKRYSPRYVHLTKLKNQTLSFIDELTAGAADKILLDFGCGDMPYKEVIQPKVASYLGIDLEMNSKADYTIDFDSKTTLPDGAGDIILSNQVLEHVDSPSGYLKEAYRLLKPNGRLLISTHGYWFYHPTPNDYWRWTSAGLRKIIEAEGFEILKFHGIMGLAASGLQLFQDGLIFKMPKFIRPVFSFFMQGLIAIFDKVNSQEQRDRDSSLYIIIAKKRNS